MKQLICITCPRGCHLEIDEETLEVKGNACPRGKEYAVNELTNPLRVITSTVKIVGAELARLPVRTDKPIAKRLMFDVMKELDKVSVSHPIKRGDIIISNILGSDVNIIACRDL